MIRHTAKILARHGDSPKGFEAAGPKNKSRYFLIIPVRDRIFS
jgi:hypothetical protein